MAERIKRSTVVWLVIAGLVGIMWLRPKKDKEGFLPVTPAVTISQPAREKVKVLRVIDGDTIELADKRRVRYIGINSPEIDDKRSRVRCQAQKAKEINEGLVLNKEIEIERDVSNLDKYQRWLRYVWIEDKMVNEKLVADGWAQVMTMPPDVKYQERFLELLREAKNAKRGLWSQITCAR